MNQPVLLYDPKYQKQETYYVCDGQLVDCPGDESIRIDLPEQNDRDTLQKLLYAYRRGEKVGSERAVSDFKFELKKLLTP